MRAVDGCVWLCRCRLSLPGGCKVFLVKSLQDAGAMTPVPPLCPAGNTRDKGTRWVVAPHVVRVVGDDGVKKGVGYRLRETLIRLDLDSKKFPGRQRVGKDTACRIRGDVVQHKWADGGNSLHQAAGDDEFSGLKTELDSRVPGPKTSSICILFFQSIPSASVKPVKESSARESPDSARGGKWSAKVQCPRGKVKTSTSAS
ncbi:hypothetical protein B0T14DRAFT_513634 [Immersiella caudata]|uniref:Uncharacterized protein n=1 Tax=Immersiella caudata TaxID=314043 RepID=A0AA39X657_9PEZI|nr:hypothetical protein B0T14DRAFT_513634 [Immersiella caudata]